MHQPTQILLVALAPAIWGSSYIVLTELLPSGYPLTIAMLRALPAGLLLLLLVRRLPNGRNWVKIFILGALNFAIFWWLLFVAAYRLPGGVAATLGAVQPLIVLLLARYFLATPLRALAIIASLAGIAGVGLLVLSPEASMDQVGILAALGGAVSMACGTVFSRRWQGSIPPLTFTAWQLLAGGILLLPAAFLLEPSLPPLTYRNLAGLIYLGLVGGALTYLLWFRGINQLGPNVIAPLGLLSPLSAVILGWAILHQQLSQVQVLGMITVLMSVWLAQRAQRPVTQL